MQESRANLIEFVIVPECLGEPLRLDESIGKVDVSVVEEDAKIEARVQDRLIKVLFYSANFTNFTSIGAVTSEYNVMNSMLTLSLKIDISEEIFEKNSK